VDWRARALAAEVERDEARESLRLSLAAWEAAGMQGRAAHDAMLALQRRVEVAERNAPADLAAQRREVEAGMQQRRQRKTALLALRARVAEMQLATLRERARRLVSVGLATTDAEIAAWRSHRDSLNAALNETEAAEMWKRGAEEPWGTRLGDEADPNYGRCCGHCGAAIRAGGRLTQECRGDDSTALCNHLVEKAMAACDYLDSHDRDEVRGRMKKCMVPIAQGFADEVANLEAKNDAWAERARASFWLAAWRGISHDVVTGIIGGPMLGRSSDVLRRVQRHTRAAYYRGER
jgi:hypothetical protein